MDRIVLLNDTREILNNAGFYVSDVYLMRPVGFDLIARRDNYLLIIKVLTNIDALTEDVAKELKLLSKLLMGSTLLIGKQSGAGLLEDDVVYDRFGIHAINIITLRNHLLEGIPLKIYAGPGGFYVNLDKETLIKIRREQNISLGSFARSIKVSRRTVRLYEEGMNARVEIASRIEKLLNLNVTIPIDILSKDSLNEKNITTINNEADNQKDLQNEIFLILKNVGYNVIPMERCPFEAVSKNKDEILLTCIHKYNDKIIKRAQIIKDISRITEKYSALFLNKETNKTNIEGTPIILKKELKKINDPEEIIELIIERICD